ncbi:MAG: molybdopterin molybdotransferase [Gaiellales bacterium]|jgi:molybdenum cofactor synthesis domain-containing protein|nr:molybdopterin molybdotransferase [Gaiellales bacterium]
MSSRTTLRGAEPQVAYDAWLSALAEAGWQAPLASESVALDAASRRVLGAPLIALAANPPHRCAAMDGYAIVAADAANGVIAPGSYLRIDTGQPVADRFDAVSQVEIAAESAAGLLVERAIAAGTNIRAAGEDVREGDLLLPSGRLLSSYDIALAAVAGHASLPVTRRPAVAILPTGGELRPPGTRLAPGEVADADGPMLQSLAREAGADCERLPARPDDAEEIGAALLDVVARSDLVLVIAGSSRGRADHTASVVERHGELVAHGVALRPAHPVALGIVEGTPVIGVPGYPVAAAVAFERFARPLLELLLGSLPEDAPLIRVRLTGAVRAKRGVEVYVPLVLSAGSDLPDALPQSRKGGALNGLAGAHALLCTRLEDGVLPAGSEVDARLLRPWPRARA